MQRLSAVWAAFAMFSRLPTPRVDWETGSLRYMMAAFPLVGLVLGAAEWACWALCVRLGLPGLLYAVLAALLPLAVTGGIHMDGYCDTIDALASHAGRERRLEILKDPHMGAFAAMGLVGYLLLYTALFEAFRPETVRAMLCLGLSFALSRSLSALAVACFPCAKDSGLLRTFADATARKYTRLWLMLWLLLLCASMAALHWRYALAGMAAAGLVFAYYRHMAQTQFGGITGDLAGWFLQLCELAMLGAMLLVQAL